MIHLLRRLALPAHAEKIGKIMDQGDGRRPGIGLNDIGGARSMKGRLARRPMPTSVPRNVEASGRGGADSLIMGRAPAARSLPGHDGLHLMVNDKLLYVL